MFTEEAKKELADVFENLEYSKDGKTAKIHVEELNTDDIVGAGMAATDHGFEIKCKRSGTGITLTLNASEE